MKYNVLNLAALVAAGLFAVGCSEKNPVNPGPVDHDIITTVTIVLTPVASPTDSIVVVWEDIDGVGGANPNRIDTLRLRPGVVYSCNVVMQNRSVTPVIDITTSIQAERDNHQLFYTLSDDLGVIAITDRDVRGLPLGLTFTLTPATTASAVGRFALKLSHYPNSADKNGTTPSDETDISIEMPTVVR